MFPVIFLKEHTIKETTETALSASFSDISIEIDSNGSPSTILYINEL
jgi:hypothetical protein